MGDSFYGQLRNQGKELFLVFGYVKHDVNCPPY